MSTLTLKLEKYIQTTRQWTGLPKRNDHLLQHNSTCTLVRRKCDLKYLDSQFFLDLNGGEATRSEFKGWGNLLRSVYPLFRFSHNEVPNKHSYWGHPLARSFYLESLSQYQHPDHFLRHADWLSLDHHTLKKHAGERLLHQFSIDELLLSAFPQFFWEKVWRFPRVACGEKKRVFVEEMILNGRGFGLVFTQRDLAAIDVGTFLRHPRGRTILRSYEHYKRVFEELYPHLIIPRHASPYYKTNNYILLGMMKSYSIARKEDWYRISNVQLAYFFRSTKVKFMIELLHFWVPEENWNYLRFSDKMNKRASQRYLGLKLMELYPKELLFEDYVYAALGRVFVFDFYFPGRKLVIEYQGEMHYGQIIAWNDFREQQNRDELKKEICLQNGFTLITIPFHWDGSLQQLREFLD